MSQHAFTFWELMERYLVQIPMIQRDYAQGRSTGNIPAIRENFLNALCLGLRGKQKLELDFIYGSIVVNNPNIQQDTFIPLDGQQRLTTLFLLHWYVAAREGKLPEGRKRLQNFRYEIRSSSSMFCNKLCEFVPDFSTSPSRSIKDQSWYSPDWQHDPTISGMLVMLDDLHQRLDAEPVWDKLIQPVATSPLVFYMVSLSDFGIPDSIYIKMNSRGKELTPLEHFKARFLLLLDEKAPDYYSPFVHKSHMEWTDIFWSSFYKKGKDGQPSSTGDSEFITYIKFITSLLHCKLYGKHPSLGKEAELFQVAAKLYTPDNASFPEVGNTLDFLFAALDAWTVQAMPEQMTIEEFFHSLFTKDGHTPGKLRLSSEVNLFARIATAATLPPMAERLLLFAVLIHRISKSEQPEERLRIVRNLLENSQNELREELEADLLNCIYEIMLHGTIPQSKGFNTAQLRHEQAKQDLLEATPDLRGPIQALEDHELLWGRLTQFDLNDKLFTRRAKAFHLVFPEPCKEECDFLLLRKALLSLGDYSQGESFDRWQFGNTRTDTWHRLLTQAKEDASIREPLTGLLDAVIGATTVSQSTSIMNSIISTFLEDSEQKKVFSWRFYFVKYEHMLDGQSGFYRWTGNFSLRMQEKDRLSGYHRNPYIWTACCLACKNDLSKLDMIENLWATGILSPGVVTIRISNVQICCEEEGWRFPYLSQSNPIWAKYKITDDRHLPLSQGENDIDGLYDKKDRIKQIVPLISKLLSS